MWRIIDMLVWIGLWTKYKIYKVPLDPVILSCQGFGCLWQAFMLIWILGSKNNLKVYHRKKFNYPPNIKLATSLMNFECQPYRIFEGLSYYKEY